MLCLLYYLLQCARESSVLLKEPLKHNLLSVIKKTGHQKFELHPKKLDRLLTNYFVKEFGIVPDSFLLSEI